MAFQYVGGMIGNPILPETEWNDSQIQMLKDMGCNFAQINIAWDSRPNNEPLNLDDIQSDVLGLMRDRVGKLKKAGMRGMLHVGMPKLRYLGHEANITPYLLPSCISDPQTLRHNAAMLRKIMHEIPDLTDFMFYTYDQHAWLCSEFGSCPRCAGIPLEDRLPGFINGIKREMAMVNKEAMFWWQPWELSLGQICQILEKIDTDHFGLMLNTAGSESYYNNLDNYWLRCITRILEERNIPFITEIQAGGSGVGTVPHQCFPCPSLVYRQIMLVKDKPTFAGVKEHFGWAESKISCNMLMFKEIMKDPEQKLDMLLSRTAMNYGSECIDLLVEAWKMSEVATDFIPFEFTYLYTNIAGFSPKHGFDVPMPEAVHADTPAWESDRAAYYLITHDMQYHPWALENAALKFRQAGDRFNQCLSLLQNALSKATNRLEDLKEQISNVNSMARACLGQYYYFKEALLAFDIRTARFQNDVNKEKVLTDQFDRIMCLDIENQQNDDLIISKYRDFKNDPCLFFETNFRQDERYWAKSYITRIDQRY